LHIESHLQLTGAKKLPSLLMGTVIVRRFYPSDIWRMADSGAGENSPKASADSPAKSSG
jgi:hypothetical protein